MRGGGDLLHLKNVALTQYPSSMAFKSKHARNGVASSLHYDIQYFRHRHWSHSNSHYHAKLFSCRWLLKTRDRTDSIIDDKSMLNTEGRKDYYLQVRSMIASCRVEVSMKWYESKATITVNLSSQWKRQLSPPSVWRGDGKDIYFVYFVRWGWAGLSAAVEVTPHSKIHENREG